MVNMRVATMLIDSLEKDNWNINIKKAEGIIDSDVVSVIYEATCFW